MMLLTAPQHDAESPPTPPDGLHFFLCGLRGQPCAAEAGALQRMGALVREIWLRDGLGMRPRNGQAHDEALIARFRAQGLFAGRPAARPARWRWSGQLARQMAWPWTVPMVAGAALLWLVAQPTLITPPMADDEASTERGAEQPQRIGCANPAAEAARIERLLAAEGVKLRRVELAGGALQLQAQIAPERESLRAALAAQGVAVPPHGRLNLVFQPQ